MLQDVGVLSYNNCSFSPLYITNVSGRVVHDNANRTTKILELTIEVDGYVTVPTSGTTIAPTMANLYTLLTAQGGALTYRGRGFDIVVNAIGVGQGANGLQDVAWGPVPDMLDFQPLGGGLSAKVVWKVTTRVPFTPRAMQHSGIAALPILQFNYETSVTYDDRGYSTLKIDGTTEVAMTRVPNQSTRTLSFTVDDIRNILDTRIFAGIDYTRYKVSQREFNVSRDKRTMEWHITVEELKYMDLPLYCTDAQGTYSFRPARAGAGLTLWLCTLRASYTVRADEPRRIAWLAFLALLREKMRFSALAQASIIAPQNPVPNGTDIRPWVLPPFNQNIEPVRFWGQALKDQTKVIGKFAKMFATLIDFGGEEGLYKNSDTSNFYATWRLTAPFDTILAASGLWQKVPEKDAQGNRLWSASVATVNKSHSWTAGQLDPRLDVIVDFGGG
jgi:hypothetical protein